MESEVGLADFSGVIPTGSKGYFDSVICDHLMILF